jgi:hypothetical protein
MALYSSWWEVHRDVMLGTVLAWKCLELVACGMSEGVYCSEQHCPLVSKQSVSNMALLGDVSQQSCHFDYHLMGFLEVLKLSETGASFWQTPHANICVLLEEAGVLLSSIMSEWALFGMQWLWKLELLVC